MELIFLKIKQVKRRKVRRSEVDKKVGFSKLKGRISDKGRKNLIPENSMHPAMSNLVTEYLHGGVFNTIIPKVHSYVCEKNLKTLDNNM